MRTARSIGVLAAVPLVIGSLVTAPAAQAASVDIDKLENTIERSVKKQTKVSVAVKCPNQVTWSRGKVFYCKVVSMRSGQKYRARVRLGAESTGKVSWKILS